MKKIWWILCMLPGMALSAAAAAQPVQPAHVAPDAFAYRSRIELSGPGPFHQLALPLAVYQGVQRHDLGDLRVFNGQGEVLPHTLLRIEPATVSQVAETAVPLFPIVGSKESRGDDISVEVRRNGDGTLVAVRQQQASGKGASIVRGAILDASRLQQGSVHSLRLEVGASAVPFHSFTLETSDDLQQWRLLKGDAQLVRLEHAGQRIEKNSVEWEADTGKYLRILWAQPEQAPAIVEAKLSSTQTSTGRTTMLWSDPMVPVRTEKDAYEYALPGRMPLEHVRIGLPQANTLVPISIQQYVEDASRRHHRHAGWQTFSHEVVFRLQSPQGGEIRSPDIALNRPALDRLRLVVDGRSGGLGSNGAPTLQIGFAPLTLVFLPRGDGPFILAWGASPIPDAALPAGTLIPGYGSGKWSASSASLQPVTIKGSAQSAAAASKEDGSPAMPKGVLWSVLIAGVLVLAGMAWMLVRQMKQTGPTPPPPPADAP